MRYLKTEPKQVGVGARAPILRPLTRINQTHHAEKKIAVFQNKRTNEQTNKQTNKISNNNNNNNNEI